ncbi:TraX family protein [Paenibacillus sp. FSL K6-0276]|uniref:TraX family protein n=2 Tax=unclassified Paenibacillus TaxID=185978 RepID=UPI0030EC6665
MQILAMLTMLIDHIGYIFFPEDIAWRYVGRIAFPIYCYGLVQGHIHTSSRPKYLFRLLLIAIIAQIPYNLAINPGGWNVVFTLLLSAIVLVILDKLSSPWLGAPVVIVAIMLMDYFPIDYNAYGLLLVLIFRYTKSYWLVGAHLALNLFYMYYNFWSVQMLSILPTLLITLTPALWGYVERHRVPRWVWWSFYPAHLLILAIFRGLIYNEWVSIEWRNLLNL